MVITINYQPPQNDKRKAAIGKICFSFLSLNLRQIHLLKEIKTSGTALQKYAIKAITSTPDSFEYA